MTALVILVVFAAIGGGWYIGLRLWPNAPCKACEGGGRNAGSNRDRWGSCRKCGGSGRRLRVGARAIERRKRR